MEENDRIKKIVFENFIARDAYDILEETNIITKRTL